MLPTKGFPCLFTINSATSLPFHSQRRTFFVCLQFTQIIHCPYKYTQDLHCHTLLSAFIVCLQSSQGLCFLLTVYLYTEGLHCLFTVYTGSSLSVTSLLKAFFACSQSTQGLHCQLTVYSGHSFPVYSLRRALTPAYSLLIAVIVCLQSVQGLHCLLTVY